MPSDLIEKGSAAFTAVLQEALQEARGSQRLNVPDKEGLIAAQQKEIDELRAEIAVLKAERGMLDSGLASHTFE